METANHRTSLRHQLSLSGRWHVGSRMAAGEASRAAEPDRTLCDWPGTVAPAVYLIGRFLPCLSGFESVSANHRAAPLETAIGSGAGHVFLAEALLGMAANLSLIAPVGGLAVEGNGAQNWVVRREGFPGPLRAHRPAMNSCTIQILRHGE